MKIVLQYNPYQFILLFPKKKYYYYYFYFAFSAIRICVYICAIVPPYNIYVYVHT